MAAIGIDFGYSEVRAAFSNGICEELDIRVIEDETGARQMPTVVTFEDKLRIVGEDAVNQGVIYPLKTVYEIKRLIGREKDDGTLARTIRNASFDATFDETRRQLRINIQNENSMQQFTAEEILATIFDKIKENAEKYLNTEVQNAVITVPSYFNHTQRQAVINAASIANINVLRLLNDSTAAAIFRTFNEVICTPKKLLIVDFGASSLDVSLIEVSRDEISVLSTAGDTSLGGIDFDDRFTNLCIKKLKHQFNVEIREETKVNHKIRQQCKKTKISLQRKLEDRLKIDSPGNGKPLHIAITRKDFEDACFDLFDRFLECVEKVFRDSETEEYEVTEVILIGGASRMSKIVSLLSDIFDKNIIETVNTEFTVAKGAAIFATYLHEKVDLKKSIREISAYFVAVTKCDDNLLNVGETLRPPVTLLMDRNSQLPLSATVDLCLKTSKKLGVSSTFIDLRISDSSFINSLRQLMSIEFETLRFNNRVFVELNFECDVNGVYKLKVEERPIESLQNVAGNDCRVRILNSELSDNDKKNVKRNFEEYKEEVRQEYIRMEQQHEFEKLFLCLKNLDKNSNDDIKSHYETRRMFAKIGVYSSIIDNKKKCSTSELQYNIQDVKQMIDKFHDVSKKVDEMRQQKVKSVKLSIESIETKLKNAKWQLDPNDISEIEKSVAYIKNWTNSNPNDNVTQCGCQEDRMETLHTQLDDLLLKNRIERTKMKYELLKYLNTLYYSLPFTNCELSTQYEHVVEQLQQNINEIRRIFNNVDLPSLSDMQLQKNILELFISEKQNMMHSEISERNEARKKIGDLVLTIAKLMDENKLILCESISNEMKATIAETNYWLKNNLMASKEDLEQKRLSLELNHTNLVTTVNRRKKIFDLRNSLLEEIRDFWNGDEMQAIKTKLSEGPGLDDIKSQLSKKRIYLEYNTFTAIEEIELFSKEVTNLKTLAVEKAKTSVAGKLKKFFNFGPGKIAQKVEQNEDTQFFGIDLGTSHCCISVFDSVAFQTISHGNSLRMPCYIAFTDAGLAVGKEAKEYFHINPKNTIYNVKRLLGRRREEVQHDVDHMSFDICAFEEMAKVERESEIKIITPEELSALLLIKLKGRVEDHYKQEVKKVAITVPAMFNSAQRRATVDAATLAGFTTVKLINETTAIALYHYWQTFLNVKSVMKPIEKHLLVVSLGAGFLSVSIANFNETCLKMVYHNGRDFGGDKFHSLIFNQLFNRDGSASYSKEDYSRNLLTCEEAKIALSSSESIRCSNNDIDLPEITRAEFTSSINMNLDSIFDCIKSAVRIAKNSNISVYGAAVAGNASQMPRIRQFLDKELNLTRVYHYSSESASLGAAVFSSIGVVEGPKPLKLSEVSSYAYTVKHDENIIACCGRNSTIPLMSLRSLKAARYGFVQYPITLWEADSFNMKTIASDTICCSASVGKEVLNLDLKIDRNGIAELIGTDIARRSSFNLSSNSAISDMRDTISQFEKLENDMKNDSLSDKCRLMDIIADWRSNRELSESEEKEFQLILSDVCKWCESDHRETDYIAKESEVKLSLRSVGSAADFVLLDLADTFF